MARQHCAPITIGVDGSKQLQSITSGFDEAFLQDLIQRHPEALPISEIDPIFRNPVPICTELYTLAGALDNLMITPSGLPVIVECKLWKNPEARREVVGQILDYAKELSQWSSSDLQREVSKRLKMLGNPVLELIRAVKPDVNEIEFNDALTANLRRGRFLLLIVGDGIREGVEAIATYIQQHAALQFTLGLVELPVYDIPGGPRLVVPRVIARTTQIVRQVVVVPESHSLEALDADDSEVEVDPEREELGNAQQRFWKEFLDPLLLIDPEQSKPKPPRMGYVSFMLPAPNGSSWITVYRDLKKSEVGPFLSATRNSAGEYAMNRIAEDWQSVREEIGGNVKLTKDRYGRRRIFESLSTASLDQPEVRHSAFVWLAERTNAFINALRPRVRSAVADIETKESIPAL